MSRSFSIFILLSSCTFNGFLAAEERTAEVVLPSRAQVADFELRENHDLVGMVVNRQGLPLAGVRVAVVDTATNNGEVPATQTDANGQFQLGKLEPGSANILIGTQTFKVRLWNRALAPPAAHQRALFVVGDAVRGQCDDAGCSGCNKCCSPHRGHFGGFFQKILCNPWIIGGATAAAIAIPIAIDNDDDDAS